MSVIFFDGVCNLCNNTVQFILKNETDKTFKFCPLQSDFAKKQLEIHGKNNKDLNSIYLLKNGVLYNKSSAALHIAKGLKFPYNLLFGFIIIPKILRDYVYNFVSKNRYKWYGKKESCMMPTPELNERFIG